MPEARRRRRTSQPPSPTSMIVNFFLDAPLDSALAALELANALVARRQLPQVSKAVRHAENFGMSQERQAATIVLAPTPPTPAPLAKEAAPASLPATPPRIAGVAAPRQRAKRSDAGKPRKQPAASAAETSTGTTTTRRRPSVTETPAASTASAAPVAMATANELPAQDVPLEARDVD